MEQLKLKSGATALVIVAHPDDETIWLGGALAHFSQIKWTILVLCRAADPDRAPKFRRVAAHFNATGLIADLEDEGRLSIARSLAPIKKIIQEQIGAQKFDYLFTHGQNGEYGHERHIAVHQAVKNLLETGRLSIGQALVFNYKKQTKYTLAPKADSNFILNLSAKEYAAKKKVMSDIYGFAPDGIDAGYCTTVEAFKILNF